MVYEHICIPIAYDFLQPKGNILSQLRFRKGRLTLGDGYYPRRILKHERRLSRDGRGMGNGRGGYASGVGVVLVEVAAARPKHAAFTAFPESI